MAKSETLLNLQAIMLYHGGFFFMMRLCTATVPMLWRYHRVGSVTVCRLKTPQHAGGTPSSRAPANRTPGFRLCPYMVTFGVLPAALTQTHRPTTLQHCLRGCHVEGSPLAAPHVPAMSTMKNVNIHYFPRRFLTDDRHVPTSG